MLYNKLKNRKIVTWLDVLEFHDEDCKRKGYSSGHAIDGDTSFREKIIKERMHQAGWTNPYGTRPLDPAPKGPGKAIREDQEVGAEIAHAARVVTEMTNAPDEPPLQPTASRVFIMAELMKIPLEATCNAQAEEMNISTESLLKLDFLTSPEFRKVREEVVERYAEFIGADMPETTDPYLYQSDERYFALEVAEDMLYSVFRKNDRNPRMPYDSRRFKLNEILAEVLVTIQLDFPDLELATTDMLLLSMIQYLSECLCELMVTRDTQLDEILHFHRRYAKGELNKELEQSKKNVRADRVMKTVAGLREELPVEEEPEEKTIPLTAEELKSELEALRSELEEKELALAEAEQKTIRQRALYEKAHKAELVLAEKLERADVEHSELIALREYVYGLKPESELELDEVTREQLVAELQNKNVAILGGTERWIKRMKKLFPNWKYVGVEDDTIGGFNALESADFIYVYTNALKHQQYYKAMDMIKRKRKMLFYLGSTNTNENIIRFHQDLCRS